MDTDTDDVELTLDLEPEPDWCPEEDSNLHALASAST
jgi:hypothetical protein